MIRTELEWAKEICKRQGYHVIPESRILELDAQTVISPVEWKHAKNRPALQDHIWMSMAHQLAFRLNDDPQVVLRSERAGDDGRLFMPPLPVIHPSMPPDQITVPEYSFGRIFQARVTVVTHPWLKPSRSPTPS